MIKFLGQAGRQADRQAGRQTDTSKYREAPPPKKDRQIKTDIILALTSFFLPTLFPQEDDNIFLSHQLTKTVITDDILNTYIGMQNEQRYKQGGEKRKQDSMIKCLDPPISM